MNNVSERPGRIWLTTRAAGKHATVSQRTVERWIQQGLLKGYKMGGRVLVDQAELDAAIANSAIPARSR